MKQTLTLVDLQEDLGRAFRGLQDGSMDVDKADALCRVAATILATAKLQVAYAVSRQDQGPIPFFELEEPEPERPPLPAMPKATTCSFHDCLQEPYADGLCTFHWRRANGDGTRKKTPVRVQVGETEA